jgi:hypothetical protein
MLDGMRTQAGIAMVTVLLVGAGMTAVVSGAAFVSIKELNSGGQDQRGASALSVAEAGVDRFIQAIKSGVVTFNMMNTAGCTNPATGAAMPPLAIPDGSVGGGTYQASLTVYNATAVNPADRMPPQACVGRPSSANKFTPVFQITSRGTLGGATRLVRQVISLKPVGLPIGLYGNLIKANGTPSTNGISVISRTTIDDRGKLDLTGNDAWYLMKDFFPGGVHGRSMNEAVPTAAHAAGGLLLKGKPQFPPRPNCTANKSGGNTQSLWDSDGSAGSGAVASGCTGQVGWPRDNKFTTADLERFKTSLSEDDHVALAQAAKSSGLYCSYPGAGGTGGISCFRKGVDLGREWNDSDISALIASGTRNFIAYFVYRSGTPTQNTLQWGNIDVWPCSNDPFMNQSAVIVVKNGGFGAINANVDFNGAIIVEGDFGKANGTARINGPVMANNFDIVGTIDFTLDDCWVRNMPGPFFQVQRGQWSEIDR